MAKTIFNIADGILTPCNVSRSRHWFRQVTAPCNVACGSGIVTVNSPSGSTLQCDTWLWDDTPLNSNMLKRRIWKSSIRLETKLCLYQTYIVPVLMYGCDTWATTKYLLSRLDAFDTWALHKILRIPYMYSPCVKCRSQKNHWLFTAFSPGD